MGLLQAAYRTYESYADRAGSLQGEEKEALTPISHIVMNAQIEITLSKEGVFQSARAVPKGENKTIVPATIESANRTSKFCPHPLCDQLSYLAPYGGDKFEAYLSPSWRSGLNQSFPTPLCGRFSPTSRVEPS